MRFLFELSVGTETSCVENIKTLTKSQVIAQITNKEKITKLSKVDLREYIVTDYLTTHSSVSNLMPINDEYFIGYIEDQEKFNIVDLYKNVTTLAIPAAKYNSNYNSAFYDNNEAKLALSGDKGVEIYAVSGF